MDMSNKKSKISGLPKATIKMVANSWDLVDNIFLFCYK